MTSLSPDHANALVQLRALLEQARQSASTTSPVGRLTALVLLDAVNERVTHLAVQTLPDVRVGARDLFEEMYSKVREALASRWSRDHGWAEVRKLHRARNNAQHEGLGADPALLPGWAIATEQYTRSLVQAVFTVSIDEVHLADAITDPDIATEVRNGEEALTDGDVVAAMDAIGRAFRQAFDRWLGQHSRAHRNGFATYYSIHIDGFEEVDKALRQTRDLVIAQSFAIDPAEYTWYSYLRNVDPITVTSEEARRALAFVFWWIVRWEAINQTIVPETVRRGRRLERLAVKTRATDRPARLESVTLKRHTVGRRVATFELTDLPPREMYEDWREAFATALMALDRADTRFVALVDDSLSMEITDDVDAAALVRQLKDLLRATEAQAALLRKQRAQEKERSDEKRIAFTDAMAALADQMPAWVEEVVPTSIENACNGVPFGLQINLADHAREHWGKIGEVIRAHQLVTAAYTTSSTASIQVEPELDAAGAVTVLRDSDPQVTPYLQAELQRVQDEERAHNELLSRLREAVS
ncbi:hypothetical protein [Actinophytocola oryzae]|uniref:Uncharacterized protein n=1 Tax=Actinophytocola oryzae TaxID=502181 RepID=A0A4V3FR80_9PSEU|nr:hypothetical protein [Actinophytocola oryzae]TDV42571.1 hypothetical protein CLV71_11740 [Actinophytocola oryzae]